MELVNFQDGNYNSFGQGPTTAQPMPYQSMPYQTVQQPLLIRPDIQNNAALYNAKIEADILKHGEKRKIDEEHMKRIMIAKEDIQIKRNMLSEVICLNEEGGFSRIQEYMMEQPKAYEFANFRLDSRPIKYITADSNAAVLCVYARLRNQEERVLYLDLENDNAGYYWKKFRKAGIIFNKKRSDKKDMILTVVQIISDGAETKVLPQKRGFYTTGAQPLQYAGRGDLIWKDVKKYAI